MPEVLKTIDHRCPLCWDEVHCFGSLRGPDGRQNPGPSPKHVRVVSCAVGDGAVAVAELTHTCRSCKQVVFAWESG